MSRSLPLHCKRRRQWYTTMTLVSYENVADFPHEFHLCIEGICVVNESEVVADTSAVAPGLRYEHDHADAHV